MRGLLFAMCAMLITAPANAETLTPRAFTDAFAAAATAAMPSATVTVKGDLYVDTRDAGGKTTTSDLRNAYDRYISDPGHFADVIRRYVALLVETVQASNAKLSLDRSRIVPVLKNQKWLDSVRTPSKGAGAAPASEPLNEPFNDELTIVYAEDRDHSIRFLTTRDDAGDRSKLHDLALANLNRLLPKIEMRGGADGLWLIEAGGEYEASLLLAEDIWASGQIKVDGDIVVAVPAKDALIVTGSRNRDGLLRLRSIAAEIAAGPYGLTPNLFVYRNGKFVKFEVP
jgi:uncharacterized protein YtpQ (UPF0354 family)